MDEFLGTWAFVHCHRPRAAAIVHRHGYNLLDESSALGRGHGAPVTFDCESILLLSTDLI
jgi:hypothetical protein